MITLTFIAVLSLGTYWFLKRRDSHMPSRVPARSIRAFFKTSKVVLGWVFFVLGVFLFPLPLPLGIPFMLIGVALIGQRDRTLRRIGVSVRLCLRRWARLPVPIIGPLGQRCLYMQREISRELRRWRWHRKGW